MNNTPTCSRDDCNHPAPNGRLCPKHHDRLAHHLAALPSLIRELAITAVGQASTNGDGLDWNAASDAWSVGQTLRVWCGELAKAGVRAPNGTLPPMHGPAHRGDVAHRCRHDTCVRIRRDRSVKPLDKAAYWATWLHSHLTVIDRQPWAGECADEVEWAHRAATRAVDITVPRLLLGQCSTPQPDGTVCEADLWAKDGDSVVQCTACPALHEVSGRRTNLLELTEDLLLTAAEIAHAVPETHQVPMSFAQIRQWVARRRLTARGSKAVDGRERPTYRVGDVLELARATATQRPRVDRQPAA